MCGVAGIVGEGSSAYQPAVERMLNAMEHRGPDGNGIYVSPSGACVLGHRRLSILDLSDDAAQPMLTADKRFAISYNGEIYNFKDLKTTLPGSGESIKSSGDTEVLLQLLSQQGSHVLKVLNGMFVFALWDETKQRLLLARDAYGQKPLYYAKFGKCLIFASEQRALLASGLVKNDLDVESTLSFLSYGWCQEPSTMLKDVKTLLRGHFIYVEPNRINLEPENFSRPSTKKRECEPGELRDLFSQAVHRTLVSDAPIGLFLSGGVDSSAVAAVASKTADQGLHTLTVTFPDFKDASEGVFAHEVADLYHTKHTEVPISGTEMLRLLPQSLAAMDQPTMDGINTYLVAYGARQVGLKAALSGLGGDELFGGYPSFRDLPSILSWRRRLNFLSPFMASAMNMGNRWNRYWGKMQGIFLEPDNLGHQYFVRRQIFSDRQLAYLAPTVVSKFHAPFLAPYRQRLLESYQKEFATPDSIGLLEADFYMNQILLRDSDVMGMAQSLEIRNPFLDKEFSQRAMAMPPRTRQARKFPKDVFVEAMGDWLPPSVRRPKQGFSLPFKQWMLNELRTEVTEGLRELGNHCSWLSQEAIDDLWENFQSQPDQVGWSRPWLLFVLSQYLKSIRMAVA